MRIKQNGVNPNKDDNNKKQESVLSEKKWGKLIVEVIVENFNERNRSVDRL